MLAAKLLPKLSRAASPAQTVAAQPLAGARRCRRRAAVDAPADDPGRLATWGWAIIALFFGLFGSWSLVAPLNGAVIANGVVKVEGNRKGLQHHDGGIVKTISVREGDSVSAGQVLLVLDDTQTRSEFDVLDAELMDLKVSAARLRAELAGQTGVTFEAGLVAEAASHPGLIVGQTQQFALRRSALDGQRRIIAEKIAQLEAQIDGAQAQAEGNRTQQSSIRNEMQTLAPLVERGVVARPRLLQLERNAAAFDGQIGELTASVARSRQAIAEQQQLAAQLDKDRSADNAKELRATEARLTDVAARLRQARQRLDGTLVRAPYGGRVVGLNVFSTGATLAPGERILEIVPDRENLIVEAQIGVEDIADVHPGAHAEVRMLAYKQRSAPALGGVVTQVSADRLVDSHDGRPYYVAQIRIADADLANAPAIKLYPGMPAAIMIPTIERTAFDYLVGPLISSFETSFRQK